jgi:murein DD-endopeptidase MepM/ murein hydrolase activator NlpD
MHNMAIHTIISTTWYSGLLILSGFLTREYLFFKAQAEQFSLLKNEYAKYIEALKHYKAPFGDTLITRKSSDYAFLLVNREPVYLLQSALTFARKYTLENAVKALYQDTHHMQQTQHDSDTIKDSVNAKNIAHTVHTQARLAEYKKMCRQALFIYPLDESRFWLSSPFGPRKNADGTWGFHRGVDLAAARGTPVRAARAGKIVRAYYSASYGNTIVIEHDNDFTTRYAHLDVILVRPQQRVTQGMCIGKVGATGAVRKSKRGGDASHLHFEIYYKGKQVNPFYYLH